MVENRRLYLDLFINSRPVPIFDGKKTYVSTGDSDDMESGQQVTFKGRPSRANVSPKIDDVIFAKMANTEKTFIVDDVMSNYIFSTGFFDITSKRIFPKYLYYLIKGNEFDSFKNAYSEGTTQISLSSERLKRIKIHYETNYSKQIRIANFLDDRIGSAELLIKNLEKEIAALSLYKMRIISETIHGTFGGEMINSGIDYIGKISSKCKLVKMRFLGEFSNGISKSSDYFGYGKPFVSYKNVYDNYELPSEVDGLIDSNKAEQGLYSVKKGDIFFTRTSETIEEVGFSSVCKETIDESCFAGFVIRFRPFSYVREKIDLNYLKYYFRSTDLRSYIDKEMMIVTRASLSQEVLKNLVVVLPPIDIQRKIGSELETKITSIDRLVLLKKEKIEKIKQYVDSLIFEYVTCKKEVVA